MQRLVVNVVGAVEADEFGAPRRDGGKHDVEMRGDILGGMFVDGIVRGLAGTKFIGFQ